MYATLQLIKACLPQVKFWATPLDSKLIPDGFFLFDCKPESNEVLSFTL